MAPDPPGPRPLGSARLPITLAAPWSRGNPAVRDRTVHAGFSGDSDDREKRGDHPLCEPWQAGARMGRARPSRPLQSRLLFVSLSLTNWGRGGANLIPPGCHEQTALCLLRAPVSLLGGVLWPRTHRGPRPDVQGQRTGTIRFTPGSLSPSGRPWCMASPPPALNPTSSAAPGTTAWDRRLAHSLGPRSISVKTQMEAARPGVRAFADGTALT